MKKDQNAPIIVTFIGPVGVGKTTQMRLLEKYLESKNRKTMKTFIKSAHGLSYILLKTFRVLGITRKRTGEDGIDTYSSSLNFQKRITPLWNLFEIISIVGKFFFTVYLPYKLGYDILIEEGLNMSIEHYKLFRPHYYGVEPSQPPLLDALLSWITSRKHLDIVLNARDQDVIERRMSRTFRRYETNKYIELQRKAISTMRGPEFFYIDTSGKSIYTVHITILDQVESRIL